MSLIADDFSVPSLREAAKEIRAERAAAPPLREPRPAKRGRQSLRRRRPLPRLGPARPPPRRTSRAGLDLYEATYAASLQEDPAPSGDPRRQR